MQIKITAFLLCACILPHFLFAQKATVKGIITDSALHERAAFASVSLIGQKDSVLVSFTRSSKEGGFLLKNIDTGNYLLLISYPGYGIYLDELKVDDGNDLNLNTIYLTPRAKLLEEIVIGQSPVRIKGDTTEYIADSFRVARHANVEELLKRLPGIMVDRDGKIITQGKEIKKVLVDGDEFFSDDPTIATKNLRADGIKKVQVFDQKSDQATFTGIDDGVLTKTINLQLKEEAKKGYFGKISVGALDEYYNLQGMLNAFKAKRKLSAFAVKGNTEKTGLSFSDAGNFGFYGGGDANIVNGQIVFTEGFNMDDLAAGDFFGQGLPESLKAGVHLSDKWREGQLTAGGDYLYNEVFNRNRSNIYTQHILEDSLYYSRASATTRSTRMQHSVNAETTMGTGTASSLKIKINGRSGTGDSENKFNTQVLSEENLRVNNLDRNTVYKGSNAAFNTNAIWRKSFQKKGRTFSVTFDQRYNDNQSNGYLLSQSTFFDPVTGQEVRENTDQKKANNYSQNIFRTRVAYTEPLSAKSFLELNYSFNNNSSDQKKLTHDDDGGGHYGKFVDSLSSDYHYIYNTHSVGMNYRLNEKKYNLSVGGNISNTTFNQRDHFLNKGRRDHYYNFFPRGNINYKFNSYTNLRLSYNGSTRQPTIEQLQPLVNNEDPLNIVIGNPDLKQEFTNNIAFGFTNFQIINDRIISLDIIFLNTIHNISNSYLVDATGHRVSQFVNVDGTYQLRLNASYNTKIPGTDLKFRFSPDAVFYQNAGFINGLENISKTFSFSPGLSLSTYQEKLEWSLSASPYYNITHSAISKSGGVKYWSHEFQVDGVLHLPGKISAGSNIKLLFRQKINAFDVNHNAVLWNAFIEKKFLKNEQFQLRLSINDILDQNKGYDRLVQSHAITETNYLTFRRYGLLTLIYNFNTTGVRDP